jgi:hypothetical protein
MLLPHQLAPLLPFVEPDRAYLDIVQINIGNDFCYNLLPYIGDASAAGLPLRMGQLNAPLLLKTLQQVAAG